MKQLMGAALAVYGLCMGAAQAQQCPQYQAAEDRIAGQYSEVVVGRGLASPTQMLVLMVNPETGTWTILVREGNGCGGVVTGGHAWTSVASPIPGTDG